MHKFTETLIHIANQISDHGNAALSKGIQWVGLTSLGTGGGLSAAKHSGMIASEKGLELADYGIIVSIIGGCTFIIKNIADVYFNHKKHKREADAAKRTEDE